MEEVWNGTFSGEAMEEAFHGWPHDIIQIYFKLTDAEPAPVARIKWAETILELAGLVADLTLYIGRKDQMTYEKERWVITHVIRRYHDSMENLRQVCDESRP